jgi:exopolysaccharide production protein ExoZ
LKPLASIQHLRAFAAMAVVIFHACQWCDVDFDIGAAGVDVFFIISGFLMWSITQDPKVTPASFLKSRVTRVAPLYWTVTLALAGLALAFPMLIVQVKPQPLHLLLSLLFVPHLDPVGDPFPLLPPGWTLNYEAILYLIFTLALFAPKPHRLAIVLSSLAAITFAGLMFVPLFPLFANPLMLEFFAGVVLARVASDQDRDGLSGRGVGAGWSLIALALVCLAMLRLLHIHSDIGRWYLWGVPAMLIVAGALIVEARGAWPESGALRRAGDASYAIYLCHWPIVAMAAKLADRLIPGRPPLIFVPATALAALIVGLMVHKTVEAPLIRWARGVRGPAAFNVP